MVPRRGPPFFRKIKWLKRRWDILFLLIFKVFWPDRPTIMTR